MSEKPSPTTDSELLYERRAADKKKEADSEWYCGFALIGGGIVLALLLFWTLQFWKPQAGPDSKCWARLR